jgi:hypothetical protein
VTLRLRALPGNDLPDLFEGDRIVGRYRKARGRQSQGRGKARRTKDDEQDEVSSNDDGDNKDSNYEAADNSSESEGDHESLDDDSSGDRAGARIKKRKQRYRIKIFKVLGIHWGLMPYVNLVLEGASARRGGGSNRSTSDRNCFAVCEVVS